MQLRTSAERKVGPVGHCGKLGLVGVGAKAREAATNVAPAGDWLLAIGGQQVAETGAGMSVQRACVCEER